MPETTTEKKDADEIQDKSGAGSEAKIKEEVEVLRETAQCIFVSNHRDKEQSNGERKELKMTEWSEYYDAGMRRTLR